jgi:hypothetical protein
MPPPPPLRPGGAICWDCVCGAIAIPREESSRAASSGKGSSGVAGGSTGQGSHVLGVRAFHLEAYQGSNLESRVP